MYMYVSWALFFLLKLLSLLLFSNFILAPLPFSKNQTVAPEFHNCVYNVYMYRSLVVYQEKVQLNQKKDKSYQSNFIKQSLQKMRSMSTKGYSTIYNYVLYVYICSFRNVCICVCLTYMGLNYD